ncbi:MAG: lysylphosphatidylglycerol synthase transmembrane domain-containing protein [Chloroflexota bacterium]
MNTTIRTQQPVGWYRRPSVWIGLVVSALSIVLLTFLVDLPGLVEQLQHADLRFVLVGFVVICGSAYLRALRWQAIVGTKIPYWNIFHAENIGYLINSILPLKAGEPARAYLLSRAKNNRELPLVEALSTVVIARLTDAISAVILLGLVLPALDVPEIVKATGYTLLAFSAVGVLILVIGAYARHWMIALLQVILNRLLPAPLTQRIVDLADSFLAGLGVLRNIPRLIFLVVTTTVLWGVYVAFYTLILMAFWPMPPLAWGVLATCAASLSLSLPSSPAAIGVFHAAVVFVMTPYLTADTAAAYAIVLHATELVALLAFGAYSLAATGLSLWGVNAAANSLAVPDPAPRDFE